MLNMSRVDTDSAGDDEDPLQIACEEARHTVNQQIEKIHREDRKAVGIFRVNILILGILTSGLSLSMRTNAVVTSQFFNAHTVLGITTLLLSSVIASMTYTSSSFDMGIKPKPVQEVRDGEHDYDAFMDKLADEYSQWLDANQRVHRFNAYAITWSIIFAIAGLVFFMGGIGTGLAETRGQLISYALLGAELVVSLVLGISVYFSDWIFELLMGGRN
jgi:hypothetical protein